ncbi:MAG: hypothetical protein C4326_10285 [Ignavibacteria bacterium]
MRTREHEQHNEPASGFPLQFKVFLAIIVGGVLYLLLQVIAIFSARTMSRSGAPVRLSEQKRAFIELSG